VLLLLKGYIAYGNLEQCVIVLFWRGYLKIVLKYVALPYKYVGGLEGNDN
jgi:high-affinity Fe2+/Pb2+ permease